jgi:hypothetical protein
MREALSECDPASTIIAFNIIGIPVFLTLLDISELVVIFSVISIISGAGSLADRYGWWKIYGLEVIVIVLSSLHVVLCEDGFGKMFAYIILSYHSLIEFGIWVGYGLNFLIRVVWVIIKMLHSCREPYANL